MPANDSSLLGDYFTRQELADELGIHVRSLERWAWLRKGPPQVRIGRRVFYRRSDVLRWLENRTEGEAA